MRNHPALVLCTLALLTATAKASDFYYQFEVQAAALPDRTTVPGWTATWKSRKIESLSDPRNPLKRPSFKVSGDPTNGGSLTLLKIARGHKGTTVSAEAVWATVADPTQVSYAWQFGNDVQPDKVGVFTAGLVGGTYGMVNFTIGGTATLTIQESPFSNGVAEERVAASQASSALPLSADGLTVYDSANGITWLADANLGASNRFGLPVCTVTDSATPCVNGTGTMNWVGATAWVAAMNAVNYLGHNNWQLPTTPLADKGCDKVGPQNNSFGFNCSLNALGSLYYKGLGLVAPATAVQIPNNEVGPFMNFQPYFYWSQSSSGGTVAGYSVVSFESGSQGGETQFNFLYVLPMIPGKIPGTPATSGTGLQLSPGGQTVYDPIAGVTWAANANLAATNAFGLPPCTGVNTPVICIAQDGAMTMASANQFIANMNSYNGSGYLGQTNWQLPPSNASCPTYGCDDSGNPMGILYYDQFGLTGAPVVPTPSVAVGSFRNFQPYYYWSCQASAIQDPCEAEGPTSASEWAFSFAEGFLGTDRLEADYFVLPYFVGNRSSTTGPLIAEVANAEGESPTIAPNAWIEIKGVDLSPAGDSRPWQSTDFVGSQMPTALDKVSVTVNGKSAYVYYISPTQINALTPPDAMTGPVQVAVTNNGVTAASFTAQASSISPSWFVFNGGPYIAAEHLNGSLIGPTTLYPGASTPAKPGETVVIYANGFGPTNMPVVSGSAMQSGTLSPLPVVQIGGVNATVQFAGLVAPGEFQFNVIVPPSLGNGDQAITASYNGSTTQAGALITIHQ